MSKPSIVATVHGAFRDEPSATNPDSGFDVVAETLAREVTAFYGADAGTLGGPSPATLATNSSLVPRRGHPLVEIYRATARRDLIDTRLLDAGCGFGALSAYFAWLGAMVHGVDVNGARLAVGRAVAEQHDLRAEFSAASLERLPSFAARFDLAVANNSLCYLTDGPRRAAALASLLAALRPGGYLVLRNPNRSHPFDQFTGLPLIHRLPPDRATRLAQVVGRARSSVLLQSPSAAVKELRTAGFCDVRWVRSPVSRRPAVATRWARYQHIIARTPDD